MNIELLTNFLKREGRLNKNQLEYILKRGELELRREENVTFLAGQVRVVGNLHGQLDTLLQILE